MGSGQGHLARYLAFHYGLNVTAIEAVGCRLKAAAEYDRKVRQDFEKLLEKRKQNADSDFAENIGTLRHIESVVRSDTSVAELLAQVGLKGKNGHLSSSSNSASDSTRDTQNPLLRREEAEGEEGEGEEEEGGGKEFVLTGLHTCGDLASTMLRVFAESKQLVGLVSVSCCYMKLTDSSTPCTTTPPLSGPAHNHHSEAGPGVAGGYPLSSFLKKLSAPPLSYAARELACHSIASYRDRAHGNFSQLKVHCYRAAVEVILRKHGLRRTQVRISKRVSKLPFQIYAQKLLLSVAGLSPSSQLSWSQEELASLEKQLLMEEEGGGGGGGEWQKVAMFFVLRLAMGPSVEAMIQLDRKLILIEQGYAKVQLYPLFDPNISPRNLLLIAS